MVAKMPLRLPLFQRLLDLLKDQHARDLGYAVSGFRLFFTWQAARSEPAVGSWLLHLCVTLNRLHFRRRVEGKPLNNARIRRVRH